MPGFLLCQREIDGEAFQPAELEVFD